MQVTPRDQGSRGTLFSPAALSFSQLEATFPAWTRPDPGDPTGEILCDVRSGECALHKGSWEWVAEDGHPGCTSHCGN